MTYKNLLYTFENRVATITINRPDKLNALNKETVQEIGAAVQTGLADQQVFAMVITSSGSKSFVAGADITEFLGLSPEQGQALAKAGHDVFKQIETASKPIIAAVNGFALGGGCELAMACHLRYASENARFGQPEVNLGLIAGYGGTQRLTQLVGKAKSMEMHLTADTLTAQQALEFGLVNAVVPQEQLITKVQEVIETMKTKAPLALAGVIASINAYYEQGIDGFETELVQFGKCFNTQDLKEGTAAFLEKRKPNFTGN